MLRTQHKHIIDLCWREQCC